MATIMVVDDEADIRLLTKLSLERDGYDVVTAEDGPTCLAAVAEAHPDLVLLDVMMPDLDGFTVLTRLKADPAAADIPVIMLTALGGPMDRVTGGIEGAVRYLVKPIDLDELRDAVTEVLAAPEASQRRAAQRNALEMLARIESNRPEGEAPPVAAPRPKLLGLERDRTPATPVVDRTMEIAAERVPLLTDKQRELLAGVAGAPTVMEAAERMGMSRSNVYASLRRIGRKLGIRDVAELLEALRGGQLPV